MKPIITNSCKVFIKIAFLTTLLILTACKESKEPTLNTTVSQTRVKPPKIDMHTAVMTDNMEALKQYFCSLHLYWYSHWILKYTFNSF